MLEGFWEVSSYRSNKKVYHFRCYQSKPLKAFLKNISSACSINLLHVCTSIGSCNKYDVTQIRNTYTHMLVQKRIRAIKTRIKKKRNVFRSRLKVLYLIAVYGAKERHEMRREREGAQLLVIGSIVLEVYRCQMDDSENDRKCQIHAGSLQHRFIGFVSVLFPYTAQIPNEIRFDIHR